MYQSVCPYPDCRSVFDCPHDADNLEDRFPVIDCCHCNRKMLAKPKALLDRLQARAPHLVGEGNLVRPLPPSRPSLIACLDDIRSLHNVGATFRTSDACGFERLYLCGITGCPPRKEIQKVSLGAEAWVSFAYRISIAEMLCDLKAIGYRIIALERNNSSRPIESFLLEHAMTLPDKICLILGNEVQGVSPEALSLADDTVHLTMRGQKESLNVSVAFGIAAYVLADCFYKLHNQA